MTAPSDDLPIGPMLRHQLRTLKSSSSELSEVLVLDNRAPWMAGPPPRKNAWRVSKALNGWSPDAASTSGDKIVRSVQDEDLHGIRTEGIASVKSVDYSRLGDAAFLARFFTVRGPATTDELGKSNVSVRTIMDRTRPSEFMGFYGPKQVGSNFLGMLEFLDACLRASEEVELCIYFDPDIFLHRNRSSEVGLVDLAARLFKEDARIVQLEPPNICHFFHAAGSTGSKCGLEPDHFRDPKTMTSRHMFIHRERLQQFLPLEVEPRDIFGKFFEQAWTNAIAEKVRSECELQFNDKDLKPGADYRAKHGDIKRRERDCELATVTGTMHCAGETFAIHPPTAFTNAEHLVAEVARAEGIPPESFQSRFTGPPHLSPQAVEGTKRLIGRIEDGNFTTDPTNGKSIARNAFDVQMSNAVMACVQMVEQASRIRQGMAWRKAAKRRRRLLTLL